MTPGFAITVEADAGDPRGLAHSVSPKALADLGGVADVHLMTVVPGAVRGNHAHARKWEILSALHTDEWELHWCEPGGTPQHRTFSGRGSVTVMVPPLVAHAVRNTGAAVLTLTALSPVAYDVDDPDNIPASLT